VPAFERPTGLVTPVRICDERPVALNAVHTLLSSARSRDGLVAALVSVTAVTAWTVSSRPRRLGGSAGIAFVAAVLGAQAFVGGLNPAAWIALLIGLTTLGAAGYLTRDIRVGQRPRSRGQLAGLAMGLVVGVTGAVLVTSHVGQPQAAWLRPLAIVVILVSGPLVADFEVRFAALGAAPVLLLVSVGGIYATVPDTERALVLVGAATPVALLALLNPRATLGRSGAFASVGTLVWAMTFGAAGRPVAMVGAVGCLGLLAEASVGCLLARRAYNRGSVRRRLVVIVVVTLQCLLVLYAAEVVGARSNLGAAVVLVTPAIAIGVMIGKGLAPLSGWNRDRGQAAGEGGS
jgi:hypothetical protein